jgi:hypothetical protein
MNTWAVVLMKKYPFMEQVAAEMIVEFGQRMWRSEDGAYKSIYSQHGYISRLVRFRVGTVWGITMGSQM